MTDNQLILGFGSTVNQPAEPHGEHEGGRNWPLVAKSRTTHPTQRPAWQLLASCATITREVIGGFLLMKPDKLKRWRQQPLTSPNSVDHRWTKATDLEP